MANRDGADDPTRRRRLACAVLSRRTFGFDVLASPRVLPVRADEQLIEQVFSRLVGNAIRDSPQRGEIDHTVETDGRDAIVSVRNHPPNRR